MSRSRKVLSVPTELPASGALRGSGIHVLRYSRTAVWASAIVAAPGSSSSRPDVVCIPRTNSTIWSSAACGGVITTSTPSPRTLSSESVTTAATSIRASAVRSRPFISQSIQTIRSEVFPFTATGAAYGVGLRPGVGPSSSACERVTPVPGSWPGVERVSQPARTMTTAMPTAMPHAVFQLAPPRCMSTAATAATTGAKTKVSIRGSRWRTGGRSIGAGSAAAWRPIPASQMPGRATGSRARAAPGHRRRAGRWGSRRRRRRRSRSADRGAQLVEAVHVGPVLRTDQVLEDDLGPGRGHRGIHAQLGRAEAAALVGRGARDVDEEVVLATEEVDVEHVRQHDHPLRVAPDLRPRLRPQPHEDERLDVQADRGRVDLRVRGAQDPRLTERPHPRQRRRRRDTQLLSERVVRRPGVLDECPQDLLVELVGPNFLRPV